MTTTLHPGKDGAGVVKRTVLPGGLRVVTESMPTVRSVAVGMWVGIGSRDESPQHMGSSHFLEHLLFKGTPTRDALEISAAIEGIGGEPTARSNSGRPSRSAPTRRPGPCIRATAESGRPAPSPASSRSIACRPAPR
ncbi:insulinase family protein, partial [Streptosporangium sp. NPDC048865]|uniref:M16 family metallopeptidase n=1 Tax=Streptosporangium sp. NPDC048865 TaxID=3155766 RepID=UPI00342732D9